MQGHVHCIQKIYRLSFPRDSKLSVKMRCPQLSYKQVSVRQGLTIYNRLYWLKFAFYIITNPFFYIIILKYLHTSFSIILSIHTLNQKIYPTQTPKTNYAKLQQASATFEIHCQYILLWATRGACIILLISRLLLRIHGTHVVSIHLDFH